MAFTGERGASMTRTTVHTCVVRVLAAIVPASPVL